MPKIHSRLAILLGAVALGLGFVPPDQAAIVRTNLLDALKPGLDGFYAAQSHWNEHTKGWSLEWPAWNAPDRSAEIAKLSDELRTSELRNRQLEITNAVLHRQLQQLERTGPSPYPSRPGQPLVDIKLLEAAVLNRAGSGLSPTERILNRGRRDGLSESDLVLEGNEPLIDQGRESRLATGHPVYCGRAVVGRLGKVGRLVSTIQKVTDKNYRGFAQLIRKTEQGFVFGAEGVIEGQGGELCRLRYISDTQPVEVGDDVYTGGHDGTQPYPMYYGRVVKAELPPGEQEWTIWVEPAVAKLKAPTVTVLRTQLDPLRTLTN